MEKFTVFTGRKAYLPIANIDTDMIIPKQYLKTILRSGLGRWLFASLRYDESGQPLSDFVLHQKPDAQILLAGENFGCGSSREHAPWALLDFGFRVVIAPGFADIFYNNAFKNGLLLVKLPAAEIAALAQSECPVTVDLEGQTVSCGTRRASFEIESNHKRTLLEGLDDIAAVLAFADDIKAYEVCARALRPWLFQGEGA